MKELSELISQEKKELMPLLNMVKSMEKKRRKENGQTKGRFEVERFRGRFRYYYVDENGKRVYAGKKYERVLREIAQRDYDILFASTLRKQFDALDRMEELAKMPHVEEVYENLHPGRKCLVVPMVLPREDFIKQWEEKNCYHNPYEFDEGREIQTKRGECVRSKSEKILADTFYDKGIPYRYEPEFVLEDGRSIYPDFVLLNVSKRKEIIWEHFGMMDDQDYANKTIKKINDYGKCGYLLGDNLIFSMESGEVGLKMDYVESLVERFLV